MPYVDDLTRRTLDAYLQPLLAQIPTNIRAGWVNYLVTSIVVAALGPQPNYERFNALIGVLECAKLELYRRAVAPYEDKKIAENGDVY